MLFGFASWPLRRSWLVRSLIAMECLWSTRSSTSQGSPGCMGVKVFIHGKVRWVMVFDCRHPELGKRDRA